MKLDRDYFLRAAQLMRKYAFELAEEEISRLNDLWQSGQDLEVSEDGEIGFPVSLRLVRPQGRSAPSFSAPQFEAQACRT